MIAFEQSELDELAAILASEKLNIVADDLEIDIAANLLVDLFDVLRGITDGLYSD